MDTDRDALAASAHRLRVTFPGYIPTRCACGRRHRSHQTATRCRRPDARRDELERQALHSEADERERRERSEARDE